MALFGKSNQEKAEDCEFIIATQNSWFRNGEIPQAIIRNIPNGGNGKTFEYFKARGCKHMYPCIQVKDCIRIVETEQTFEIQTRLQGFKIVPKTQVMEIQYFQDVDK